MSKNSLVITRHFEPNKEYLQNQMLGPMVNLVSAVIDRMLGNGELVIKNGMMTTPGEGHILSLPMEVESVK